MDKMTALCVTMDRLYPVFYKLCVCGGVWVCFQVAGGSPRSCNAVRAAGARTVLTTLDEQHKTVRALPQFQSG